MRPTIRAFFAASHVGDDCVSKSVPCAGRDFGMEVALAGLRRRGFDPAVIYDIGAASGGWARLVVGIWPKARVICFEPLPQHAQSLEELSKEFPGRVDVHACGVADTDATLALGVTDSLLDSSFAYGGTSSLNVPVSRLDTLFARGRIPAAAFLKVDVQGFERRVLDGAGEVLKAAELVLLECQFFPFCAEMRTLDESIAHMSSLDFVPYEFVDLLRRPLDGAMGQCDILFVRKGHRLVADHRWTA